MYKHNCAHCTLNGILRKPMAPTCAISFSATSSCTGSNTGVRPRRFSSKHVDSAEKFDAFHTNFTWLCVCVLQTNLAQVKASNLKNMPVFEAQTTGMCKTFPNLLHRHVYTTFTDLSCCYVIEQGTYPGFIRHAPLEIHALLVD